MTRRQQTKGKRGGVRRENASVARGNTKAGNRQKIRSSRKKDENGRYHNTKGHIKKKRVHKNVRACVRRAGRITVDRSYTGKDGVIDDSSNEQLSIRKFLVEPASVSHHLGVTTSTGRYESLRVDVAISIPCYREELNDAMKYLEVTVKSKLDEILVRTQDEIDQSKITDELITE